MQQLIFSLALTVSVFSEVLVNEWLVYKLLISSGKEVFPFAYEPLNVHRQPRPV
jgi:hypothetical protein